jgi:hypothetical protein
MSHFEDRAFFYATAAQSRMRGWFSVENPAIMICMFVCVVGMIGILILAAEGLSKPTDWYEPTPMNFVGP